MTALFRLLSRLPLGVLHGLGWGLGWLVFATSGVYRRRFQAHARQAGCSARAWRAAVGQAGMLVAVAVADGEEARAIDVLRRQGAEKIERAEGNIEQGDWKDFNPLSVPQFV